MALVLKDRVKESTITTGTGSLSLLGAPTGYQDFSAIGNGNTCYYTISSANGSQWEVGYGTYNSVGPTLSRDVILSSSAAGAVVDLVAGIKEVYVVYPAEKAIYEELNGQTLIDGGPITIIGANVTTIPSLPAELGKYVGNIDSFAQIYTLNQFNGSDASADFVAYNNQTTDGYNYFTDMGINSGSYNSASYPIFTPNSGYLFHDGDNMYVGTATNNKDLVLFAGGVDTNNVVAVLGADLSTTLYGELTSQNITATGATFTDPVLTSSASALSPANNEFVTKAYVDNVSSTGIHIHTPCASETSAALSAVYVQGGTTFNITDITGGDTVVTSTIHGLAVNDEIWLTTTAGNGLSINTPYFVYATPTSTSLQLSTTYSGVLLTGLTNASGLSYATRANSGVGAYLEASANEALPISGVIVGDRVLVYQQATGYWNGVYVIDDLGSVSSKWKLTRATDANKYQPDNTLGLGAGDYFFIQSNSEAYVLTNPTGAIIVGYDAITYTLFSAVPAYTVNSPLQLVGTTLSLNTVPATLGGTGTNTTAIGDLLYGTASNTWSKLAVGAPYKTLVMNGAGTLPEWNAVALDQSGAVSGVLSEVYGGTNNSSYTLGDTLYASAANTLSKLPGNTTTTKKFLGQTGTGAVSQAPVWEQPSASDITGLAPSATTDTTNASNITSGTLNNARTTATASNGASTIVARDVNGSFAANLGAFVSVSGDGSAVTSLNASAIASGTVPTANLGSGTANTTTYLRGDSTWATLPAPNDGTLTMSVSGTGLTGSASFSADQAGNSTFTVASNATDANSSSTIVARDASGNFSANTITAALNGNASTATTASTANALNTANSYTAIGYTLNSTGTERAVAWTLTGKSVNLFCRDSDDTLGVYDTGTAQVRWTSDVSGNFVAAGNVTAYSDERLKKDWSSLSPNFVERLATVKHGTYTRIDTNERQAGASAQAMRELLPEVVLEDAEGTLSLAYGNAALVAAIELAKQVVELKKEIELLKAR